MLGFAGTRNWVYVQHIDGRFQQLRRRTFIGLHLILFGLPWLRIGGNPALLFDLPGRRLYAFGASFTASDTLLLLIVLLFLAFSLFFFTALFGRLWCGYACPQTVLLDAWVHPVERWLEGERTTRMRRDNGGWTWDRSWRKGVKWALFTLAAFVVSMSFMSFFTPARDLWTGTAGSASYALVAFFTGVWFLDFTWFREQFCNYLCPYARFQSVMVDDHTLTISYDPVRGEPRGGKSAKLEGRCIDCSKCVVVCPTGIDIRNGFQLECIGCARCVDACTDVMGRFGHDTLVGYGTLTAAQLQAAPVQANAAAQQAAAAVQQSAAAQQVAAPRPRLWRPRTIGYAALLTGLTAALVILLAVRVPFDAAVARAPGSTYTIDPDGYVRNTYLLRISNNLRGDPVSFTIGVEGLEGAQLTSPALELASTEGRLVPVVVRLPGGMAKGRAMPVKMRIASSRAGERVLETTFMTAGAATGL
jgi:cytochrome c oxidase accessory protein FixG